MCAVLNISSKTYYKYRNKEDPDYYDYLIIKEIFDDSKGTYGYRRIVEGTSGSGATDGESSTASKGGTGQGYSTREFEEESGKLYASGGSGTIDADAEDNTGDGGSRNEGSLGKGGSGIVIIRNARKTKTVK